MQHLSKGIDVLNARLLLETKPILESNAKFHHDENSVYET